MTAILGLDTCLDACSVALVVNGQTVAESQDVIGRGHTERLAPMVGDLLADAHMAGRDLTRVVVTTGPGSFAGVRVGLSFARAFVIGLAADCVGMTTLQALAVSAPTAPVSTGVLINARRGQVFGQVFDANHQPLCEAFVLDPAVVEKHLNETGTPTPSRFIGSGVPQVFPGRTPSSWPVFPDPAAMARFVRALPHPDQPPAATYLRAPDAKPPRRSPPGI